MAQSRALSLDLGEFFPSLSWHPDCINRIKDCPLISFGSSDFTDLKWAGVDTWRNLTDYAKNYKLTISWELYNPEKSIGPSDFILWGTMSSLPEFQPHLREYYNSSKAINLGALKFSPVGAELPGPIFPQQPDHIGRRPARPPSIGITF